MPMTASLLINAHVRNVTAYDHMGGNHPLPGLSGAELHIDDQPEVILTSTHCCCHGAEGVLDVRGEVETATDVWEARQDRFKLHQDEVKEWPL